MGLKLLICDDNIVQVKSIREFVKWNELGVSEIEVAYDGKEAEENHKGSQHSHKRQLL